MNVPTKVLVVDAFDSFVYIIRQYLLSAGAEPIVVRSNELTLTDIRTMRPDAILLGPGPGHPSESGHVEIIKAFGDQLPILGVCLGHQAIGLAFGGEVVPAHHLMHGKTSKVRHDGTGLFAGMPEDFSATRYHSLVVVQNTVPDCLQVTAWSCDDRYVMGLRHRWLPIESVQFHPESICTQNGLLMIKNFVRGCASSPAWHQRRSFARLRPQASPGSTKNGTLSEALSA
ncbi:aminodeoxychorismate/anthranilate synthase component II [Kibdelosporangium philippinense]|uniref:Aminodeoxychorismate/anthranilate synthase component II n=1 Tax=Kibdelosporangium philippinense TaxID=211113 RepID=A0ABS8Z2Z8_9PSEU|nr:aminodeoxychorismate/anthranilate synthase component II [Kibdelosporangium philippinense]MCE7002303.1 aminodeoxychorismate/anthranilate synthase component II [Kibdelosporangium philippinense]